MKVIFLDIDGVLVNRESLKRGGGLRAKAWPSCVAALNTITDSTGAAIVVSSTWRYYFDLYGMGDKLKSWGVKGEVIGATEDLSRKSGVLYEAIQRGDEIQSWLDGALFHIGEDVESFVILDDDSDMKHLLPNLIATKFESGLTMEDAAKAISLLSTNVKSSEQPSTPKRVSSQTDGKAQSSAS